MALLINCTVSSTRDGTTVYASRACQLDTTPLKRAPTIPGTEQLQEIGGLDLATLYDTASAGGGDWQAGDQVTVLTALGVSPWRVGTRFGVYSAMPMGGGLPHVTATLVTIPTFTQQVTLSRGAFASGTGKTSAPAEVGTITAYVRDMSAQFTLAGIAPSFRLQVVTDGASDLQQGDTLTGITLSTGPRTPILTVQHIARHMLAGWLYLVADVVVKE